MNRFDSKMLQTFSSQKMLLFLKINNIGTSSGYSKLS